MSSTPLQLSQQNESAVVSHLLRKLETAVKDENVSDIILYYELNASIMQKVPWDDVPQKVLDLMLNARTMIYKMNPSIELSDDHLAFDRPTGFELFTSGGSIIVQATTVNIAIKRYEASTQEKVIDFRLADDQIPAFKKNQAVSSTGSQVL